jgi:hypothetical protein
MSNEMGYTTCTTAKVRYDPQAERDALEFELEFPDDVTVTRVATPEQAAALMALFHGADMVTLEDGESGQYVEFHLERREFSGVMAEDVAAEERAANEAEGEDGQP